MEDSPLIRLVRNIQQLFLSLLSGSHIMMSCSHDNNLFYQVHTSSVWITLDSNSLPDNGRTWSRILLRLDGSVHGALRHRHPHPIQVHPDGVYHDVPWSGSSPLCSQIQEGVINCSLHCVMVLLAIIVCCVDGSCFLVKII